MCVRLSLQGDAIAEYDTIISELVATCVDTLAVVKFDLRAPYALSIRGSTLLHPFTQLCCLRVCDISWNGDLEFHDEELRAFAQASPQLTTFTLSWDGCEATNAARPSRMLST